MSQTLAQNTYSKEPDIPDYAPEKYLYDYYETIISGKVEICTADPIGVDKFTIDQSWTYPSGTPGILQHDNISEDIGIGYFKIIDNDNNQDTQYNNVILFKRNLKINILNASVKKELGFKITDEKIMKQKKELEKLRMKHGIR